MSLFIALKGTMFLFSFIPYPVKGFLEVSEDMVETLLMLQVFLAEDPEIEYLFCGAPSGSET